MTPSTLPLPQLKRVRWAVRGALTLGVAASVAANILHARSNPVSQIIAAWPPLALLLTIELVSRVPVHSRSLAVVRVCATTTIATIAAWVSYWHMAGVAARYGEIGASPYLLPFSVDGLVVITSVSLVELAGRIRAAQQPAEAPAVDEPVDVQEPADDEPADVMASDATPSPNPYHPTAVKIRRLRQRNPNITQEETADKVRVSVRTVARYWPVTAPDTTPDTAPANGRQPELTTTTTT